MPDPSIDTSEALVGKNNDNRRRAKVFACIPAYNQEASIEEVVKRTLTHVDHVIVVDDGSFDRTAELAENAGAIVISHPDNLGYGSAIKSALLMALKQKADVIVTLDADLQHNPDEIPLLMRPILDGEAEIVIGSRFLAKKSNIPVYRKFGIKFLTRVSGYDGVHVTDAQSGFRGYSASALKRILPHLTSSNMSISIEIMQEAGKNRCRVVEVPIIVSYDVKQRSKQNPFSHGVQVAYSVVYYIALRRPLLFVGVPGIAILAVGLWGLFTLFDRFNESGLIPTGLGIFTLATSLLGLVLIVAAVILVVIARLSSEIRSIKKASRFDY
jgi:glycosyltransferase involved in cell wall biosynthesis